MWGSAFKNQTISHAHSPNTFEIALKWVYICPKQYSHSLASPCLFVCLLFQCEGCEGLRLPEQFGELQERVVALKERLQTLGDVCLQTGEKLKTIGQLPDPSLGMALTRVREEYDRLAADCCAMAQDLMPLKMSKKITSLVDLEWLCNKMKKNFAVLQEHKEDWVNLFLATAHKLTLPGGEKAAELTAFRKKLDSYAQILKHRRPDNETAFALRREFQAGKHPLNALFKLLETNLSYREAAEKFSAVAAEFGMPLAVAAIRGDLVLPNGMDSDIVTQFSAGLTAASGGGGKLQRSSDLAAFSDDRCKPPYFSRLICDLIATGKLGPAYWLACYSKQISGDAPVPAWLIRALETASLLQGRGGRAAECLTYLYAQHDFLSFSSEEPAQRLPGALLVFAALLRPALLAPETGAAALLGKLQYLPESLQNLAKVLAEAAKAGVTAGGETVREKRLQNISMDVQSWLRQNQKLALASPLAAQLWEKMQAEGGLIHRLFQPLLEGEGGNVEDARQLCFHLGKKDNLVQELKMFYEENAGPAEKMEILHLPGSWQIISLLKTALKFVESYLQFAAETTKKKEIKAFVPAKDFFSLWETARKELREITWQGKVDPLSSAALAVTWRALDSLEKLLQEDDFQSLTPGEVYSLELENNPQLMLKPSWQPQKETIERLGKALLEFLSERHRFPKTMDEKDDFYVMESPADYDSEGKGNTVFPADLDNLFRSGALTPQEREFIYDIFKSING